MPYIRTSKILPEQILNTFSMDIAKDKIAFATSYAHNFKQDL